MENDCTHYKTCGLSITDACGIHCKNYSRSKAKNKKGIKYSYIIVTGKDTLDMEIAVTSKLQHGYVLHGSGYCATKDNTVIYCQPMRQSKY